MGGHTVTIELDYNSELANCGRRYKDIFERMGNELTLKDLENTEKMLDSRGSWAYTTKPKKRKLVRIDDGLTQFGLVEFIEFDEGGRGESVHPKPAVGRSCVVGLRGSEYTWMTSEIVEVLSGTKFKTKNSEYEIGGI